MDKQKVWLGIIGEIRIKLINQADAKHDKIFELLYEVDRCPDIKDFIKIIAKIEKKSFKRQMHNFV
jgi:hypothetical protein